MDGREVDGYYISKAYDGTDLEEPEIFYASAGVPDYILLTKGSGEADWGRESTQYLAEKGIDVSTSSFKELKATASDIG